MRYMYLIYDNEKALAGRSKEEGEKSMGEWWAYSEELRKAGKMVSGDPLQPTATATTVRMNGTKALMTDGPFAETKEQLGGFYIVDAKDLDEATRWAAKMPHLPHGGSVEVRPIMEFE